jgi:hypothetical protein
MRGSFRPQSLVDLLALAGWSLLAAGRARFQANRGRPLVELAVDSRPPHASMTLNREHGYDPWRVN